jgi:FAD/FMN-containing dehydrogenase
MLGGGHGWLQGQYGLAADNLISARLTLANATTITVSEGENPELFWAVRGAGHNFGIVTSFEIKVHDRTPENEVWSYESMVFKGDQVEAVYEAANSVLLREEHEQPVELAHLSYFIRSPEVDPNNVSPPSLHTCVATTGADREWDSPSSSSTSFSSHPTASHPPTPNPSTSSDP